MKGKTALITGASRGIGRAVATELARRGAAVAVNYLCSEDEVLDLLDIVKKNGGTAHAFKADIGRVREVENLFDQVINHFGGIDILVNNAAVIGPMGEISEIDSEAFFSTLRNNIGGTIFCTKAIVPYMKSQKRGSIINLSGGGGLSPLPYYDAYSASKAAIVRLTENFALELEKFNINVTAISPGAVNTKMFTEQLEAGDGRW